MYHFFFELGTQLQSLGSVSGIGLSSSLDNRSFSPDLSDRLDHGQVSSGGNIVRNGVPRSQGHPATAGGVEVYMASGFMAVISSRMGIIPPLRGVDKTKTAYALFIPELPSSKVRESFLCLVDAETVLSSLR